MNRPHRPGRLVVAAAATTIAASLALVSVATPAQAEETDAYGELLLALDASGSMLESDGLDSTRIDAASRAVEEVTETMPTDAQVGLRAYGPPTTGEGCKASDVMVPVGPVDDKAINSAVEDLEPAGDTPIAYSLEQAADDFTDAEGPKSILLISDGEETCDGDPVAVAEKLTDEGIDLRVHVIGFQVEDEAREQLNDVAKAGRGTYHDAADGAALANRLKRASEHALRPYETTGTPIEGSTDGLNLPELTPGQYVDTMPSDTKDTEAARFYAVDVPEGADAYVSATIPWSVPLGAEGANHIRVRMGTQDFSCETATDRTAPNGGGSATTSATVTLRADNEAKSGECHGPGRYIIQVDNNQNDDRKGTAPLELSLVLEPAASDTDSLAEPYVTEDEEVNLKDTKEATDITGAGGLSEAPIVESGNYNDILRPGEEVYYRVPLDWGQQLSYQFNLPKVDPEVDEQLGSGTHLTTEIINPVRQNATQEGSQNREYYTGEPGTATGTAAPVRYRNRASDDQAVANAAVSGYYYVAVRMDANTEDPYFELPVTLQVAVDGEPEGAPSYDTSGGLDTPAEQLEVKLASESNPNADKKASSGHATLLWAGIGIGAVLVLGGGGTVWLLLRGRPTGVTS